MARKIPSCVLSSVAVFRGSCGGFKYINKSMGRTKCLYDSLSLEEYNKVEKTCKRCGKSYYIAWTKSGYSDFCCEGCSRAYSTDLNRKGINEKVSKKLKGRYVGQNKNYYSSRKSYDESPNKCLICGKSISYENKHRKYCSGDCCREARSLNAKKLNQEGKLCGGYRRGSSRGRGGYYKGVWCDSTYELAYLVYCLDNRIDIQRCKEVFKYNINRTIKKYHPDFLVEGIIVEIKNYWREEVDVKTEAVKKEGRKIRVLYGADLEPYMCYVDEKYNLWHKGKRNNYYVLYDNNET